MSRIRSRWLGRTTPSREPRRSLAFLAGSCTIVAVPVAAELVAVDLLVRGTSALLIAVSLTGTAAAVRLLRGRSRRVSITASVFLGALLLACGPLLLLPAGIGAAALVVGSGSRQGPVYSPFARDDRLVPSVDAEREMIESFTILPYLGSPTGRGAVGGGGANE